MQIHLKQAEIESALRDYITKLGIKLQGREVTINFTSGRQGRGLTADLDIPDIDDLPDFPDEEEVPVKPAPHLKAVETPAQAEEAPQDKPAEEDPPVESSPATGTTSLFGS